MLAPTLPDRFEITYCLGEGGMGMVYEAIDRVRGERVALKTLRWLSAEAIYRMKLEFRSLADLEHPNLVRLYDLFVEEEHCFFTMELISGVDLTTYVTGQARSKQLSTDSDLPLDPELPPYEESRLRSALAGLARGVEALHDAKLLHRDLKPSNVMVTGDGRVVVLDFGLVVDATAKHQLTHTGEVSGTAAYMAPEQARGDSGLTTAADVYALGVILYELLTGVSPFTGTPLAVLVAKQGPDVPRASDVRSTVPSDLDTLALRLMAREPSARPDIHQVLAALDARPSRRLPSMPSTRPEDELVGREKELAWLRNAHARRESGTLNIALLKGRSGIGKSALLHTFARQTERSGALVLAARCYESESVPFKGLDGIVDTLSSVLARMPKEQCADLLPPNLTELATLFPVLRRVEAIAMARRQSDFENQSAQRTRSRGFACLRALLRRLGEERHLILIIDDVQWADDDSARGIVELVVGERPPLLTLVLGARPDDSAPIVRELFGTKVDAAIAPLPRSVLELGPLSEEALRELAVRELGENTKLVEAVVRDAEGSPFAAGELARFLREDEQHETALETSTRIDTVVRRRVARLPPAARDALAILAVAGEPTPVRLLLRALAAPADDARPFDLLRARAFARSVRVGPASGLDTAHDRIREATLQSLEASDRATLHAQLASALEGLADPPHERIARHYLAAHERVLGRWHTVAAAKQATDALAFERAAKLYGFALELSDEQGQHDLLVPYAEMLHQAGRHADAARAWLRAAAHAQGAEARERKRFAGEAWIYAGRIDDGLELFATVASEMGVTIPRARWRVLAKVLWGQVRLAIRGLAFRVRARSELPKAELARVQTLGAIATQYPAVDSIGSLVPSIRYVLAALDLGDPDELASALAQEAVLRDFVGFHRGAKRIIARLDALADEAGSPAVRAWTEGARGFSALQRGQWNVARECSDASLRHAHSIRSTPDRILSTLHYAHAIPLSWELQSESFQPVATFVQDRRERSGEYAEMRLRSRALQVHDLLRGRAEQVVAFADDPRWEVVSRRDPTARGPARAWAGYACLYLGEIAHGAAQADLVWEAVRRQGGHRTSLARTSLCPLLGACGLALGDARRVRRARRQLGRPRTQLDALHGWILDAMTAYAAGEAAACRTALGKVRSFCQANGFPLWEAMACRVLGILDPEREGAAARARYAECIQGKNIVDPDLYIWTFFPAGERPPRTGRSH